MSQFALDPETFSTHLSTAITRELTDVGQVLVDKAVEDIQKQLRARLAEMVVALISTQYSIAHDGRVIRIEVRLQPERAR